MSQEVYFGEVDVRRFDRFEALLERIASKLEESASAPCLMYSGVMEQCDVFGEGRCGGTACNLARRTLP